MNSYKTEGTQAGDWYLPSMGELYAIYDNKDALDIALGKIGRTKFSADYYWSSSENSNFHAWQLRFSDGYVSYDNKSISNLYVRPVIDYGDWANSSAGDEEDASQTCDVGDIFYSDKTCSADVVSGKTPIGVVFDTINRLIIGLEQSSSRLKWSSSIYFDVPGLSNIASSSAVTADLKGKKNTQIVLEYCSANGYSCPAFEYVNSYKTEGTQAGDWYLPAFGELDAIYGNRDALNITLGKIGGTKFSPDLYWSSSECSNRYAWYLTSSNIHENLGDKDRDTFYVRPVMQY